MGCVGSCGLEQLWISPNVCFGLMFLWCAISWEHLLSFLANCPTSGVDAALYFSLKYHPPGRPTK